MYLDSRVVNYVYFVLKEVLKVISVRFPFNLVIVFEKKIEKQQTFEFSLNDFLRIQ